MQHKHLLLAYLLTTCCGTAEAQNFEEMRSPQAIDRALTAAEKRIDVLNNKINSLATNELRVGNYVSGFDVNVGVGGYMIPLYSPVPIKISRALFVARVSAGTGSFGVALYNINNISRAQINKPSVPGATMEFTQGLDATLIGRAINTKSFASATFSRLAFDFDKEYTISGDGTNVLAIQSDTAANIIQGYDTDFLDRAILFPYDGSRPVGNFNQNVNLSSSDDFPLYAVLRSAQARGLASQ